MGWRTAAVIACVSSCIGAGCAQRTQIVVVADTDLAVPQEIDTIRIDVRGPDGMRKTAKADLRRTKRPTMLGLVHRDGPYGPMHITVTGELRGQPVLHRVARTSFVQGRTLRLDMDLLRSCVGHMCPEEQTCTVEGCVSVNVVPSELPEWNGPPPARETSMMPRDRDAGMDAGGDSGRSIDAGRDAPAQLRDSGRGRPFDAGRDASDATMGPLEPSARDATMGECRVADDCDDGVSCTVDRCTDGTCKHVPADTACADDGVACTVERCDPASGCRHVAEDSRCDDGIACTVDACGKDGCVAEPDHTRCARGERCEVGPGCTTATTFTTIYDEVLSTRCSPCHTHGAKPKGKLDMSSRSEAYADLVGVTARCGAGSRTRVVPYESKDSLLWRKVAGTHMCGARMPKERSKLPMHRIDQIAEWIEAGAADN